MYATLTIILLSAILVALSVGRYNVKVSDIFKIIVEKIVNPSFNSKDSIVIIQMRIPRIFTSILVGAGLSVSGVTFQGMFQNKLVSPDILGVSSGAGFGAALGILITEEVGILTGILAFSFGISGVLITFIIAKFLTDKTPITLVLSGIIVSAGFNSLLSFIKLTSDKDSVLPAITYWLMGSFSPSTLSKLKTVAVPILFGIFIIFLYGRKLNILTLGDDEAYMLGINPKNTRIILASCCSLITACCVMTSGIIGWIGIIIPNICRMYIGSDNRRLILFSAMTGSIFMLIVDTVSRTLTSMEIPVGILISLIGAPLFVLIYGKGSN